MTARGTDGGARRRGLVAAALALVVLAGLGAATRVPDPWGDVGGDVLYAVAAYLLVLLAVPTVRPRSAGLVALGWCWLVEVAQATDLVARVIDEVPPAAWLLGSTFAVRDLVCYAVGVVCAAVLDAAATAPRARTTG